MSNHADALARIYARSLFEMAMAAGGDPAVEEALDELEQIVAAQADPAFARFIGSAMIAKSRRKELLQKAFKGRVSDLTLRFLLVLNANNRLSRFNSIVAAFNELHEQHYGRMPVEIITAGPLGDEQLQMLKQKIQAVLGSEPILHQSVDPSMIGGLKVKVGDRLIDGSVSGRLRRMRHGLLTTGQAAVRQRTASVVEEDGR
jgi:F-type H+-transporting ATPase subunit delta